MNDEAATLETAAYLAIGAHAEIQNGGAGVAERNGGHVGVIAQVVAIAPALSELAEQFPDAFDVWAYDVAKPAGAVAVQMLAEGKKPDAYRIFRRVLLPREEGIYAVLSEGEARLAYYNEGHFPEWDEWDGEPVPDVTRWMSASAENVANGELDAVGVLLLKNGGGYPVLPETRPLGRCSCTDPECLHPSAPGGEGDCSGRNEAPPPRVRDRRRKGGQARR